MPDERMPMIGAAEHVTSRYKEQIEATAQGWQAETWRLFGALGEFNSAATWIANGLSQIAVSIEKYMPEEGWVVDDNATSMAVLASMGDQSNLLRAWGLNSTVAGEAFWVRAEDRWSMRSRSEIAFNDRGGVILDEYGTSTVRRGGRIRGQARTPKGPSAQDLWRFWLPNPQFSKLAATPPQAFTDDMEQLRLLRLVLNSKLNTRLWMNGVWVFSQALTLPTQTSDGTPGRGPSFIAKLRETLQANMQRQTQASAKDVMPILVQTNTPEVGEVVKIFYPETAIDEREAALRAEIRQTLRELLDLPVEMQTKLGDSNHWASWSIVDVNKIYSLLPRARALLNAMSWSWLRAELMAAGMAADEAYRRRLVPNVALLRGEPSSDEMRQAHDRVAVTDTALRRATRVEESDAPTGDEYVRQIGRKMNDPYLALWGTEEHEKIDWSMVRAKTGAPGIGTDRPDRAPGVGDPGSPTDPNSEVGDE
jgi:hypothetical protein